MKYRKLNFLLFLIINYSLFSCVKKEKSKIGGVNYVAPINVVKDSSLFGLQRINANWVAYNPYAFGHSDGDILYFNTDRQWWGETSEGVTKMVKMAHQQNLKVMVKPHLWIKGQGWAGDLDLKENKKWEKWEKCYAKYILTYAEICEEQGVEILCMGTEIRNSVKKRPFFWKKLIQKTRTIYSGKLTYASNWDNYHNVTFWEQLDYIGIDNYFPVSEENTPALQDLNRAWLPIFEQLKEFSTQHKKQILFTEFGYRSINKTAGKQWDLPNHWDQSVRPNFEAQTVAFQSFFGTFWDADWVAGGFIWKWYYNNGNHYKTHNTDYTPQNKPASGIIKLYFGKVK